MIRQHLLQQQRLNDNHERLLQRYSQLVTPHMSQFQTFGASSLPGRNYDQHLNMLNGNSHRRTSLVAQSRATVGPSSETYRWLGDGAAENLPRNINSVMQHTRQQTMPLVHAEKFEPVQVYEHPIFGLTPAYLRPVYNENQPSHEADNDELDDDDDDDDRDKIRPNTSVKTDRKVETNPTSTDDNHEGHDYTPKGYISYKKWKAKYENVIPVNPLLFSIYTQRSNGSIDSYGQALLYTPSNHLNRYEQINREGDLLTPTPSDSASVSSELPRETSTTSARRYNRLKPQSFPSTLTPRTADPIGTRNKSDTSDDELSPPDSPVPYLSRKSNPITSTPLSTTTTTFPTIGIKPSPMSTTPSAMNLSTNINTGASQSLITPTGTAAIPPAPPLPSSLSATTTTTAIPPAPPLPSSLSATTTTTAIPPAPPLPSSLSTTTPITYQTPSSLPIVPSARGPLSTSSTNTAYQTPSSIFQSSVAGSTGKAVTFGGSTSVPAAANDASSSSDSDDEEKQKRRRRKKKRAAAAAAGITVDDSSSDD